MWLYKIANSPFFFPNRILPTCNFISNRFHTFNNENGPTKFALLAKFRPKESLNSPLLYQSRRSTNFYKRLTAEELWKSETTVSNAGMKRGRGARNKKSRSIDLNRGQYLGHGKINMSWPGLNQRVAEKDEINKLKQLPHDEEYFANIIKLRETHAPGAKKGLFSIDPLERGWSGIRYPGRKVGPPDPVAGEQFEGFESIVLESKIVVKMDAKFGRKRRQSMLVVTGNGNGVAGYGLSKAATVHEVLRKSKSKAGRSLIYVERCEDRTVFHDFHTQFRNTEIFVHRKPEGYGLKCHRGIKAICQVLGIKDLYAKIEGSTNILCVTRAFFIGLLNQRNHQQLAEEKGLHVVKLQSGFLPTVLASPKTHLRTKDEISATEEMNYDIYAMGGKIPLIRPKFKLDYSKIPPSQLKSHSKKRNHKQIKHDLLVEYGQIKSFLHEKYPECINRIHQPPQEEEG